MAKTTEQMQRLTAIAADDAHPLQRTAQAALRKLAGAERREREERAALSAGPVRRYRVNGEWKLTERIADYDLEGDAVNGASDRTGVMGTGRTLRPVHTQPAPALAPEPKYEQKPGWGFIQDRERSPKQALLDSRAFAARTGS